MTRTFTRTLAAGLLAMAAVPAFAVPADPRPITVTQPDGTDVTISMRGDEAFHYMVDSEGYLLGRDAQGYLRILDNDGQVTSLLPMAYALRPDADKEQLMTINPARSFEALRARNTHQGLATYASSLRNAPMRKAVSAGKWDNSDGHDLREIPTEGERPVLVILVSYNDLKWSFSADSQAEMTRMLNEKDYTGNHCTGSAKDYFLASSNGLYQPRFDVYGPVTLPNGYAYYGANSGGSDGKPFEMVKDACILLDDTIDYSIYDTNGDGVVDNIYIFYAGYGENEGAGDNYVWPHSWDFRYAGAPTVCDGVQLGHYACSNELTLRQINGEKTHAGIGTFCHEFSHVLGLPDLYATSYTGAMTPAEYSVMDHGSYNNNSRTPPLYSIYEKYALEWQKPIEISDPVSINMQASVDGGNAYKMTIDPSRPTEYYLFENRQQHSWDTFLPGHGMLVWHIDFDPSVWGSNVVNNTPEHQYCDLVEADGSPTSNGDAGDTFPGTGGIGEFTSAFANWNGKVSSLPITDIYEHGGVVSFKAGSGDYTASPLHVNAPAIRLTGASDDSLTLEWYPVAGATGYSITAQCLKYDEFDGLLVEDLEGYEFKSVGSATSHTITGLEPDTSYEITLYAHSDSNLSNGAVGGYSTFPTDLAEVTPKLTVEPWAVNARLDWVEVPGADTYNVTVATRSQSQGDVIDSNGFDNRKAGGWLFTGLYDEREDYVGASSPSLRLTQQNAQLESDYYTDDVESVSLWTRVNKDNAAFSLKLYSVADNGAMQEIGSRSVSANSKEGTRMTFSNIPAGVRHLIFVYTFRTSGLQINIDDIEVRTVGDITDTPVAGYDNYAATGNSLRVEGLSELTDYVAYITASGNGATSRRSNVVAFHTSDVAGIDGVENAPAPFTFADGVVTAAEAVDIFSIDGSAVALKARGAVQLPARGIYVVRSASATTKLIW